MQLQIGWRVVRPLQKVSSDLAHAHEKNLFRCDSCFAHIFASVAKLKAAKPKKMIEEPTLTPAALALIGRTTCYTFGKKGAPHAVTCRSQAGGKKQWIKKHGYYTIPLPPAPVEESSEEEE